MTGQAESIAVYVVQRVHIRQNLSDEEILRYTRWLKEIGFDCVHNQAGEIYGEGVVGGCSVLLEIYKFKTAEYPHGRFALVKITYDEHRFELVSGAVSLQGFGDLIVNTIVKEDKHGFLWEIGSSPAMDREIALLNCRLREENKQRLLALN